MFLTLLLYLEFFLRHLRFEHFFYFMESTIVFTDTYFFLSKMYIFNGWWVRDGESQGKKPFLFCCLKKNQSCYMLLNSNEVIASDKSNRTKDQFYWMQWSFHVYLNILQILLVWILSDSKFHNFPFHGSHSANLGWGRDDIFFQFILPYLQRPQRKDL